MQAQAYDRIDALFSHWDQPDKPGLAVGICQDGELVYERGLGCAHLEQRTPLTADTVFHVASLSKQFTAIVAALLAKEGRLCLDDDLHRYVPELPPGPPITFRHAIHHTSGLREQWDLLRLAGWRDPDLKTTGDILELVSRQTAVNFPPGHRFQYINTAYTLMAVAIERITGETLRTCAERLIFGPLDMRHTFFLDDASEIIPGRAQAYGMRRNGRLGINVPNFETVGPTNLHTTVRDLALWERNLVKPVIGDEDLFRMAATPGRFPEGAVTDYGFGLIIGHHGAHATVEHAGGDAAFRAYYLRIPAEHFAVVILANIMEVGPGRIARRIIDICLPQPNGEPAQTHTAPLDAKLPDLERISGRYRHADSGLTCRIVPKGGRLLLESNGASYELVATGGLGFRFLDLDVTVSFDLPDSGPASSMSVRSGGNTTNVCARVDLDAEPAASPLEEYQGRYVSADLDVAYTVTATEGILRVRGPRGMLIRLRRITGDGFAAMDTTLDVQFQRDNGRISGFLLSSERAWNIDFRRT